MRAFRFGVLAALASVVAAFAAGGVSAASDVVGQLYVNDNTAGVNTVAGFDRHADGSLTPISGSPFAIGGAGTGHGVASQGSLQQSADGRYLLAVDAGSNQISVLRIKPHGQLQVADVVSSNGENPVSIAVSGGLVYVANAAATAPNYTGFTLNAGGHLRAIASSTVTLPDASQPGDVLFNGDGTKLVGTRVNTSLIDSFTVGSNGLLTAAAGSPFAAQGLGPFGSEFRPTNPTQLFVSNAHGGPTTAPSRRSPTPPTGRSARSAPRRSRTTRPRRAGSRSATTASSCSPSTPRSRRSRATRSLPTAPSRCSATRTWTRPRTARRTPGSHRTAQRCGSWTRPRTRSAASRSTAAR